MRKFWTYAECRGLLTYLDGGRSINGIHIMFNGNRSKDALRSRRNALAKIGITTVAQFNERYGAITMGVMPSLKSVSMLPEIEQLYYGQAKAQTNVFDYKEDILDANFSNHFGSGLLKALPRKTIPEQLRDLGFRGKITLDLGE